MSIFWSKAAREITPYTPGEQPKDRHYIKLNTNENPYPPSPKVIKAIRRAANSDLKLYPDPTCDEFRAALAEYYHVDKEQVFVGNGSDEVLAFSFLAFFSPGDTLYFPDITYSFYQVYAKLFHIDYKLIPLHDDFSIALPEFYNSQAGGVIISNPNAPTGKYLPFDQIQPILEHCRNKVVIIDEAYIDFGGLSATKYIQDYPNLLIVQTLSKSRSLAGLRLGFCFGQRELIEGLNRIKNSINSYTVDRLALAGGIEAIRDEAYFRKIRSRIIKTRQRVTDHLRETGFKVIDSMANFLFISHPVCPAHNLLHLLKEEGILVRHFNAPRIDNYLRVSIGSDEEMDIFIESIKTLCSSVKF